MVKIQGLLHKFKKLSFLVVIVITSIPALAYSDLQVSVSHNKTELGKPVYLELHSQQAAISLENIDLNVLKNDFYLKHISDINQNNNTQTQHVTLYPRKTGSLSVPALYFINTRTEPIKLNITPARDPKDNSILDVKYSVSTFSPWKKQQVLVTFTLTGQAKILRLNTLQAYSNHSEILSLQPSSTVVVQNNDRLIRHATGWAIFPRQDGQKQIELPGVQLVRDGVVTHQFYPPLLNLDVKPLPVYIPATMPVGILRLATTHQPNRLSLTDTIYNNEIILKANGVMPSALPSLVENFKSNVSINFYPATVRQYIQIKDIGVHTKQTYSINYKTLQQGMRSLGTIHLNYFDPHSGTIRSLQHDIGKTFSLHTSIAVIIILLVIFPGYILISKAIKMVVFKWRSFLVYKNILNSIAELKNARDIQQTLVKISTAENWRENITLRQWHQRWNEKFGTTCPIDINQLEVMLYADQVGEIEYLKRGIQQLCLSRWSLLKTLEHTSKKGV